MKAKFIYEIFTQDSDPIKDLGVGKRYLIKKWLDQMDIENYVINDDFTIDVNYKPGQITPFDSVGGVDLMNKLNGNLPKYIKFNIIHGKFLCDYCNMTTLRGCPKIVEHYFSCGNNKLTSLDHMPKKTRNVYCENNKRVFSVKEVLDRCDVEITIFASNRDNYDWINPNYGI